MGKMLLEKCDTITKEAAESQAALQNEVPTKHSIGSFRYIYALFNAI